MRVVFTRAVVTVEIVSVVTIGDQDSMRTGTRGATAHISS
ncbi:hypothetical protein LMG32289_05339 [Cupriavidus pampae]|uniref:Uncharacterized protein n=1 Tax=Cupriavidus pampae TaxID=659251 RepID=A0ABM8XSJ3_9BURK|nr:hypothetical protein LMG32289_05339 [Cupriavidus pampae]